MRLLSKLRLRHQIVLFAAIVLFAVWGITVLILLPQHERLEAVRAEYHRELQEVRVVEMFTVNHPDVEAYLTELDQKRIFVGKMLPDTLGLEDYVALLESAAKQSGVRLEQVIPIEAEEKGNYQETRLEVSFKGSFPQTLHFLKRLDEGPRFSIVSSAALYAVQGTMDGKMVIKVFCLAAR